AGATETYTVSFTASAGNPGGALAAGGTITVTFNGSFTVPATPTVTIVNGGSSNFSGCGNTRSVTGNVVTITLTNSGGTCSLPKAKSGQFPVAGTTTPSAAGNYAGNSVATSADTTAGTASIAIVAGAAATATFSTQPSGATGGVAFITQPVVHVVD